MSTINICAFEICVNFYRIMMKFNFFIIRFTGRFPDFWNCFWLLVPMPMKLFRYTLWILCNVFDTFSDIFSHSTPIMAEKIRLCMYLSLKLDNFWNKFWLLVPLPIKLWKYTLLILCNVLDALSENFSHSTPHYGCKCDAVVKSWADIRQFPR